MRRMRISNIVYWGVAASMVTAGTVAGFAKTVPTDDRTVTHVLNRLAFGPRPGDVERVKAIGIERYVDQQLRPDRISDAGMNARLATLADRRDELT